MKAALILWTTMAGIIIASSSHAQVRDRLEGWGPFKFEMSRVQAMEAIRPRARIGSRSQTNIAYVVVIDGIEFSAEVYLSDDLSAIQQIVLQAINDKATSGVESKEKCLSSIESFVAQLNEKYGSPDSWSDAEENFANLSVPSFKRTYFYRFRDGGEIQASSSVTLERKQETLNVKAKLQRCSRRILYNSGTMRAPGASF